MKTKKIRCSILFTAAIAAITSFPSCGVDTNNANQHHPTDVESVSDRVEVNKEKTISTPEPVGYFHGIDIAHYNGDEAEEIDASDSLTFIICKATEGITGVDPKFSRNWKWIKDKKMILGSYHFYLTDDDPILQAKHYWAILSAQGKTDMTPIVDIEQLSLPNNGNTVGNPYIIQIKLLKFLNHIENASGRIPMIYTGPAFANQYLRNTIFSKYALWLAEYGVPEPHIPHAWKNKGYKIWQKSESHTIDSQPSDYDSYHGKKSDLYN